MGAREWAKKVVGSINFNSLCRALQSSLCIHTLPRLLRHSMPEYLVLQLYAFRSIAQRGSIDR